jgi:hypothetical protein
MKKTTKKTVKKAVAKKTTKKAVKNTTNSVASKSTRKMGDRTKRNEAGEWNRYEYEKQYHDRIRASSNEIGQLPEIVNPQRRADCEYDLVKFCTIYLNKHFYRPWSENQLIIAKEVQQVVESGGSQAIAAKRRGAKTTICKGAMIWAMLYGKHKYSLFIAATEEKSIDAKEFFSNEIYYNKRLLEDFPEICIPFGRQKKAIQRQLTYYGMPCDITFTKNIFQFPTMRQYDREGNPILDESGEHLHLPNSGSIIRFYSCSSNVRGSNESLSDQGNFRPSLAFVDDPQNDGSAKSELQIGNLESFVNATLSPMSGYDADGFIKPPSILVAVTCIQPNDFAVRILNREKNPHYNGILFRRFVSMPYNMNLWREYREHWRKDGGDFRKPCMEKEATKFYIKNRAAMDEGAKVDDENDYTRFHLSAIQYGMDRWCENEAAFWTEHQNDPERAMENIAGLLTPTLVLSKLRRFERFKTRTSQRCIVPDGTEFMTAFIDVGDHYLNYEVVAFGESYSFAHVVDFGWFPDQKGWYNITKHNYNMDLQLHYRNVSVEDKISAGIHQCMKNIFTQQYVDEGGQPIDIHRDTNYLIGREGRMSKFLAVCGVDANDHDQEHAVWYAIARFNMETSSEELPVHGRAIPCYGDKTRRLHMRDFVLKPREWQRGRDIQNFGDGDWIEYPFTKSAIFRRFNQGVTSCLLFEANTYRTMRDKAWKTRMGELGCQTLLDDSPHKLDQYVKQQCSMKPKAKNLPGSEYIEWEKRKEVAYDKEFFDTNVGCFMLASYVGMNPETGGEGIVLDYDTPTVTSWFDKLKQSDKPKDGRHPVRGRRW